MDRKSTLAVGSQFLNLQPDANGFRLSFETQPKTPMNADAYGTESISEVAMIHPTPMRRGITLLFVISLIVLFLLMGATFVAISTNFMRTSRGREALEVRGDSARTTIDRALMDLIRGTTNPNSALNNATLGDQSILADMYATGFKGQVASAVFDADGQMIRLTLNVTTPPADLTLLDKVGAFGGHVLTFDSNTANATVKGVSCRIFHHDVQYDGTGAVTGRSFLIVPEWTNGLNPFATPADLVGASVLVNGRAFDGDGSMARPNETFDAIDDKTAFLGGVDFADGSKIFASFFHFDTAVNPVYESFRPTRFQGTPLADANGDGRPDFEVDNDGDGVNDSIWVDLGYPIQTDSTGRQYKPLVAYFVLDLDGRFNLNLHGSGDDARGRIVGNLPLLGAPAAVTQGQGYGPGEISLGRLFPPPGGFPATLANYNQEYFNILGDPASTLFGRFGPAGPTGIYAPGVSEVQDPWSQFKLFGYPTVGIGNAFGSRLDVHGHYGWGFTNLIDASGLLPYGMPQVDATPPADDVIDNPYETDMSGYPSAGPGENPLVAAGSTRPDQLYSLKELERIYRSFDVDSKFLADRLLTLAPTTLGNPANRLRVSTDSWEVPVPPSNSAVDLANMIQAVDPARMADIALSPVMPGVPEGQSSMLAPEVMQGLKMDINRPFGNGVDDNGNGYVDEYFADGGGENPEPIPYPTGPVDADFSRNGQATPDEPGVARIVFAKQLFCLALTRLQGAGDFNTEGSPIDVDDDDRVALAQWAINVVDFRDQDAIMTPFECDLHPENGWITDGSLLTDESNDGLDNDNNGLTDGADPNEQPTERFIVWGCERPELLISETFAAHDRRTEDTSEGGTFAGGDAAHFDSRLVPVASAFVELYAPWVAGNDMTYPTELYVGDQLNLGQTTTSGDPVWRIQIVRDGDAGNPHYDMIGAADARDMDPDAGFLTAVNAYRYLYFVQPPAAFAASAGAESFYPSAGFNTMLSVGQHAVIGSAGNLPVAAGQYVSTFGRRITALEGDVISFDFPNTRSVTLDPAAGEVQVRDWDTAAGAMATRTRTGVVAIPIDQPRSFNVTDPPNGYLVDSLGSPIPFLPVEDGLVFAAIRDVPIDYELRQSDVEFNSLKDNHTEPSFRVIYLQRLANPLAQWDPVLNPYLTVDGATFNVTAYNGVTSDVDMTPFGPSTNAEEMNRDFAAMERGKSEKYTTPRDVPLASIDDRRLLWPQERRLHRRPQTGGPPPTPIVAAYDDIGQPAPLSQLLAGADQHFFSSTMFESLGTYNDAYFGADVGLGTIPTGTNPFTWLTWSNRPYVSQYELMLVPTKSCSQLLKTYSAKGSTDPYNITTATDLNGSGFQHLGNFFLEQTGGPPLPFFVNMQLYKMLDYLEVPSRYVGTERNLYSNPATSMSTFGLAPPFNTASRFRYPGKLNINTVLDRELWTALMGDYANAIPAGGPFLDYDTMNTSRRDIVSGQFYQPFRDTVIDPAVGVSGGLLRKGAGTNALFSYDPGDFSLQQPHNNSDRNAYFRYDAIQRLGNLVTTRSSVFAIWITVGYFEIDPGTGDFLGTTPQSCELGADAGQIKRHRGFFIYDRSIPVGYERGVDHNVDRAIMVQSYIE